MFDGIILPPASQWESPSCLPSPTQDRTRNSKEEKAGSAEQQAGIQNVGIVLHSDVY